VDADSVYASSAYVLLVACV
jgi:mannose/fructose/N-acetylgalactosamine-specific phosphotransferase system component IIC